MKYVIIILIGLLPILGLSQSVRCNENDCGTVDPGWRLENSESIVCEGTPFLLIGDESTPLDMIQTYRWIIQDVDGTIILDTAFSDLTPLEYLYVNLNDSTCIGKDEIDIDVTLQTSFVCNDGESCRSSTEPLKIILLPRADFQPIQEACLGKSISFSNNSCYEQEYEWDFGDGSSSSDESPTHIYNQRGTYRVQLQVSNQCGSDMITKSIRVVEQPIAGSSFIQDTLTLCIPATLSLSDASNSDSRTSWEINPPLHPDSAWCLVDTNMTLRNDNLDILFKEQGDYEVKVVAENACGVDEKVTTIRAVDQPSALLMSPPQYCELAMYTPEVSYSNQTGISSVEWSFEGGTPSTSQDLIPSNIEFNATGEYDVTLIIKSPCGDRTYTTKVEVIPRIQPEIVANKSIFCRNELPDTLGVNVTGGEWEGEGIIDTDLGIFDPGAVISSGQIVIRYVVSGSECAGDDEITFEIKEVPQVNIQEASFCVDDISTQLIADLGMGIWSGDGISPTGLFNPSEAKVGLNPISYVVAASNGCDAIAMTEILVEAKPSINLPSSLELCRTKDNVDLNDVLSLELNGSTIQWSGEGITNAQGIFNGGSLTEDTILLEVLQLTELCDTLRLVTLILSDQLELNITPDTTICVGQNSLALYSNIAGGRWEGPSIDAETGIIDLTSGINGPQRFEYIVNQGTSCEQSQTSIIDIIDLGLNLSGGGDQEACEGDGIITLQGASPSGGTWRGEGLMNTELGTVDLALLSDIDTAFYEYCLESQIVVGCEACARKMLLINKLPIVDMDFNPEFCRGSSFQFENSAAQDYRFSWNFNEFGSSTQRDPTITIDSTGIFQYEVIISNSANCDISIQGQLSVFDAPTAGFSLESEEGCAPFVIEIIDMSSGKDIERRWTLDESPIRDEDLQGFVIDSLLFDSVFTLSQIVSNGCGERIDQQEIIVLAQAISSIGVNADEGCSPFNIEIGNASRGNPQTYLWNYGNGESSTEENPIQPVYINNTDTPLQYEISLIVSNSCATDTAVQAITVDPPNVNAFIQLDTLSACPPFQLQLQSFSTSGALVNWEWISESGQVGTSAEANPFVIFDESGTYKIKLAASQCGTDFDSATIQVLELPIADFNLPSMICIGDTIRIDNSSSVGLSTSWDFGDGSRSNSMYPLLAYDTSGIYNVALAVTNAEGCSDTLTREIGVRGIPEISSSISSIVGCPPLATSISTQASANLSYLWTTSDGQTSTDQDPEFTFTNAGSFTVRGVSIDAFGCRSLEFAEDVTVSPSPIASFELREDEFCIGEDSIFSSNTSTGATAYQWVLDADIISSREDFSLSPLRSGSSELTLKVVNEFGCRDMLTRIIRVDEVPELILNLEMISNCENQFSTVSNLGSEADFYNWTVSDGREFTDNELSISFNQAGIYDLQLIGRNGATCSDTLSLAAYFQIFESPIADFDVIENPDPTILGEVQFNSLSTDYSNLEWDFGDGTFSDQINPLHEYNINRPISVFHRAINTNDGLHICIDEKIELISPEWLSTFYVPNALSPDSGSEKVRQFLPVGLGIANYDISIYSPWGEIIWYSTSLVDGSPSEGWKGLLPSGDPAPQGVYIFKANIRYENGDVVSERGAVHLIR